MTSAPLHAPASTPGFPPRLDDVPSEARVAERFGWLAGLTTIAGFAYAIVGLLTSRQVDMRSIALHVGCIVGAILFGWYEGYRRAHRTVLVARGYDVGIYRKGALNVVIRRDQIARYELRLVNTIRYLAFPMIFGPLMFLGGGATFASSGKLDSLGLALLGAFICSVAVSLIWTRVVCKHFFVPKGNDREELLFTSDDMKKLFG